MFVAAIGLEAILGRREDCLPHGDLYQALTDSVARQWL
jgi:hypothetical protein